MARKIRLSELRKLAALQCTRTEAAAFFGIAYTTFNTILKKDARARAAWEEGGETGKISLRRKQMALASKNATMAIFLGKQILNQREVQHQRIAGEDGGPVQVFNTERLSSDEKRDLRRSLRKARKS